MSNWNLVCLNCGGNSKFSIKKKNGVVYATCTNCNRYKVTLIAEKKAVVA